MEENQTKELLLDVSLLFHPKQPSKVSQEPMSLLGGQKSAILAHLGTFLQNKMRKIELAPIEAMDREFLEAAFEQEQAQKESANQFSDLRLNSVASAPELFRRARFQHKKVMNGLQLDWCSRMIEADNLVFVGDMSGHIHCYDLKRNKSMSWLVEESYTIRAMKIYKHLLLVAIEKGEGPLIIYNLKTMDLDKKIAPYQTKKLDNIDDMTGFYCIEVREEDGVGVAYVGDMEGNLRAFNIEDDSTAPIRSIKEILANHEGPKIIFSKHYEDGILVTNHHQELVYYHDGASETLIEYVYEYDMYYFELWKNICFLSIQDDNRRRYLKKFNLKTREVESEDVTDELGNDLMFSVSNDGETMMLCGSKTVKLVNGDMEVIFTFKNGKPVHAGLFSHDDSYLIFLFKDGSVGFFDYKVKAKDPPFEIPETIYNAHNDPSLNFFALYCDEAIRVYSSEGRHIYSSEFEPMKMMCFTAKGEELVMYNFTTVRIVYLDNDKSKITERDFPVDEHDELRGVRANHKYQRVYIKFGRWWYKQVFVYSYAGEKLKKFEYVEGMAVSKDEEVLALCMNNIISFVRCDTHEVVHQYEVKDDDVLELTFFPDNQRLCIMGKKKFKIVNIYTEKVEVNEEMGFENWNKVEVLPSGLILMERGAGNVYIYQYSNEQLTLLMRSEDIYQKGYLYLYGGEPLHSRTSWCVGGGYLIYQDPEVVEAVRLPILSEENSRQDQDKLRVFKGLYFPPFSGKDKGFLGTFGELYDRAYADRDVPLLREMIYPYQCNALHHFTISKNFAALAFCFENGVEFAADIFGKTPLHYAKESGNVLMVDQIYKCIMNLQEDKAAKAMKLIPLYEFQNTSSLGKLLDKYGTCQPEEVRFAKASVIPQQYSLEETAFATSTVDLYSHQVSKQMHPPQESVDNQQPITTRVLSNPLAESYTTESIAMLKAFQEEYSDAAVKSKPVAMVLSKKWGDNGFKFHLIQLLLFLSLLISLMLIFNFVPVVYPPVDGETNPIAKKISATMAIFSCVLTIYFLLYEIVQFMIQGREYLGVTNMIDVVRIIFTFQVVIQVLLSKDVAVAQLNIMFLLLWLKIFKYLGVFSSTRYLIKMTMEICADIQVFLVVLFTGMVAYFQLLLTMGEIYEVEGIYGAFQQAYVISLGELSYELPMFQFIFFVIFSFFIPLLLMNMLIAIMSSAYERIQENSDAADARMLSELQLEYEEIVTFFTKQKEKIQHYFLFYSEEQEAEADEDSIESVQQAIKENMEQVKGVQDMLAEVLQEVKELKEKKE